jgi:DNA-binding SARP family transcriptional activator/WD40 repeat protein
MLLHVSTPDFEIGAGNYVRGVDCRVLGPVEVLAAGARVGLGGPKQRTVVAVLVAAAGGPVMVDTLLQALYGEDASPSSRATLQTYVSNLRHALGDVIVRRGDSYLLDCSAATIDATAFEDAYRTATAMADADRVSSGLREALAMWRGHPYSDVDAHGYLDGEVTRLTELRLSALEARIDADMRAGRDREVVGELDALTVEHPFRENLRAMHMLALYRSGRQAEALRAYGHTRDVLVEGLGIDPSPQLKELERRILAQDRDLLIAVGPTVLRRAVLVADIDDAGWHDPAEREITFGRRDSELAKAADRESGVTLTPKGTAGYVVFTEPIRAVRAARAVVNERTRVAVDWGDLEMRVEEPVGPPLARAARLVAIAHPGQVLLSSAAHDALTAAAQAGWAAESLGRFDIVGLDPGVHVYQLVGHGFAADFPALRIDRLPPPVPSGLERSVPGYELRGLIGVGELGEVHRAYQPSVGREVAVRIFGPGMVGHPQFVRRFETASQRITRVEHPYVVPLLDYWREPKRAVMVCRLMTGGDLGQRIPIGGFDEPSALAVLESVGAAVASAHRHGVVHGRVRPENVLFDEEDNAYLADLGVDEICAGVITFASSAYDAPERLGGVLATQAADVYSLGVLVHHLLGGSAPSPDGALSIGDGPAAAVVGRATDPDPRRRHESVEQLISEMRGALAIPSDPTTGFAPARNPYRGLAAFEQADAEDFYGRDRAVAEMVTTLDRERLLVVVGPSGIGKSSVVKAGLVPALARGAVSGSESWLVTEMVPGRHPFEQLAAALERVGNVALPDAVGALTESGSALDDVVRQVVARGAEVLVIVDQLEELFTQTVDDDDRRAFLHLMVDLANRRNAVVRLVATLRADYFDRPLGYAGFDDVLRGRTIALGAMSTAELADAVRLPAAAVGVGVEPALVERITAEAELQPGGLPLVQHTLAELFDRRKTNTITLADFDEAGGLAGAVGRRADAIYESLDECARENARRVFLRLVSVNEGHEDTRRRVRRTELEQAGIPAEDLETVLGDFGGHRLLTFDRDPASRTPTVELAHEALLTQWERYRGWVEDARQDLLTRRRVESAAHDWVNSGSDASFLYGGGRLELVESWAAGSGFELMDDERRFLAASREKADRDRAARAKRRRRIVGMLVAALVVTTVAAGVALVQRRNADREGAETRARELAGQARLAVEENPERAVLLALAAMETTDVPLPEAVSALQQATQSMRVVTTVDGVLQTSFDQRPDGTLIAVDRLDATGYVIIDPANGEIVEEVTTEHHPGDDAISFAPSGTTLAVAYQGPQDEQTGAFLPHDGDPAVQRFEVPGGRVVGSLSGPAGSYHSPDHDASGRWLAAIHLGVDESREIVVWDVAARGPPRSLGPGTWFDFLPGSDSVVLLGPRLTGLAVVDLMTADIIRELETPDLVDYQVVEIDPSGRLAALISPVGRRVDILDLTNGRVEATLEMPTPTALEFSPDGSVLAVGGNDNLVRLFDMGTFTEAGRLAGSPGQPFGLAFLPDRSQLVSGTTGQVRTWDLSPEGPASLGGFHVSGGFPGRFVVSADESAAFVTVYTGARAALHRLDLTSGKDEELLADLRLHGTWPVVAPNLSIAAALDAKDVTNVVDLATGRTRTLGRCEAVLALDQSGRLAALDGRILCTDVQGPPPLPGPAVASRVVDLRTGRTLLDLGDTVVWGAAFGPPGDDGLAGIVAVVNANTGVVTLHDLTAAGAEVGRYVPDESMFPLNLAISPDGSRLALSMTTGQLIVVDIAALATADDPDDAVAWTVTAHSGSVQSVSVSESGWIATASSAGNVRVWSADGELVADLPIRLNDPPTLGFAPGTDTLYYEGGPGVIRRFVIDPDYNARLARSLLTLGFTDDECARHFPGESCPTLNE